MTGQVISSARQEHQEIRDIYIKYREKERISGGNEGVAIWFDEMGLDAFVHLRNIVSYNAGNPDGIMAEFKASARTHP